MGQLFYGGSPSPLTIADELLAYVRLIVNAKLRNGESFMISWHLEHDDPADRSSIWVHPAVALRFVFERPAATEIDKTLLARLRDAANGAAGLVLPSAADLIDERQRAQPGLVTPLGADGRRRVRSSDAEGRVMRSA